MSKMLRMTEEQFRTASSKPFSANEKKKLARRRIKTVELFPTEHQEQCRVIAWCDAHPIAKTIFAIPNGSHKSPAMAAKFKREGLRPGVPDLFLPVPSKGYHGLFIEMKRTRGSVTSTAQKEWEHELREFGYGYYCCKGAEDAIQSIQNYLGE